MTLMARTAERLMSTEVSTEVWAIGVPRLLAGIAEYGRLDLPTHLRAHGPPTQRSRETLTAWCSAVGLLGRGGAAFPVADKLAALPARGIEAVVVNGSESEPGSAKDRTLLRRAPHLVLDGAVLVAAAVGARSVVVSVHDGPAADSVVAATAERTDPMPVRVHRSAGGFVAGEARAMLVGIAGGAALPPGRRVHATTVGLRARPSFVSNAETFAQLTVLGRLGPHLFASTGLRDEAGTTLLSVGGALGRRGVVEVPLGTPLDVVLRAADASDTAAVLLGGYHGSWVDAAAAQPLAVRAGTPLGAGVVLVLDSRTCPLGEVARVAHWLAGESARQCGPCVFGLPALADALDGVLRGSARSRELARRRAGLLPGRGACTHPDGAARFVSTALQRFGADLDAHRMPGGCGRPVLAQLPLPGGGVR